jgi:hypothetical protein
MSDPLSRPPDDELTPQHGDYLREVPAGDVLETLEAQLEATVAFLRKIGEERALRRYAPGKWSIKEVVGHVIDLERIFGYRALRFGRGDVVELSDFSQALLVRGGGFDRRPLESLIEEFTRVRRSHLALFASFDEAAWVRRGPAGGFEFSVRSIPFIVAGHERHHMRVIGERYL